MRLGVWICGIMILATSGLRAADEPVREAPAILNAMKHGVGREIPDLAFSDLSGRSHRLSDWRDRAALVIAFTGTGCPLTKKYAPELARLEKRFADRGVGFVYVNPNASDEPETIRKDVADHGFVGPYMRDVKGLMGAHLKASSSTEVFVLNPSRTLMYRGAIDDRYGFGYALESPRQAFLVDALEAILAGRSIEVGATTAPGCVLAFDRDVESQDLLTYHGRVSHIVQQHCLRCHREGGLGPFTLDEPEDLVDRRAMIRRVVERGIMPPWFAAPGTGPWHNDASLPEADRRDLLAWLASNDHPLGDPAQSPQPMVFPKGWSIGAPDLVVELPRAVSVKAEGQMPYVNLNVPTTFTEDRWIQAVEVQPTAREVVHHVLVFAEAPEKPGELPRDRIRRRVAERSGFVAAYVPGNDHVIYPDGLAKKLPAGSTLHFQLHYTPNGKATTDRTKLGIVFLKQPLKHEIHTASVANRRIRIPAGAANHEETARLPVPWDVQILALMPHMHLRGKAFRYEAVLPGGQRQLMLDVPRYDFNWQLSYRYAEPLKLPRGSRIEVAAHFDNSAGNPANPDPTREVRWGDQSDEEMLLGYLEYIRP